MLVYDNWVEGNTCYTPDVEEKLEELQATLLDIQALEDVAADVSTGPDASFPTEDAQGPESDVVTIEDQNAAESQTFAEENPEAASVATIDERIAAVVDTIQKFVSDAGLSINSFVSTIEQRYFTKTNSGAAKQDSEK